jgi:succinate dehydrogenase hydrophobic anchor subunit
MLSLTRHQQARSLQLLATVAARSPTTAATTTARRLLSAKAPAPLEADSGGLATHVHHAMTIGLAVLTPIYFIVPDSYTDSAVNKAFGVFLSANFAAHSWIGLNYVATDYVPKVSKALLGPARFVNFGIFVITFFGMSKIAIAGPGGIKGAVKGLWNPNKTEKKDVLHDF